MDAQAFAIGEFSLDFGLLLGWRAGWLLVGSLAAFAGLAGLLVLLGEVADGAGLLVCWLGQAGLGCACWLKGSWLAGSLARSSISFLYRFL